MHPPAALGQDLDDRDAAHTERVAHHRAVAAPRHRFGAHDRNALFTAQADECGKRVAEFLGLQVIGKAPRKASFRQPVFGESLPSNG